MHPTQHACWAVASHTANLDHALIWHLAATTLQSQKNNDHVLVPVSTRRRTKKTSALPAADHGPGVWLLDNKG